MADHILLSMCGQHMNKHWYVVNGKVLVAFISLLAHNLAKTTAVCGFYGNHLFSGRHTGAKMF